MSKRKKPPKVWNKVPLGKAVDIVIGGTPSRKDDSLWQNTEFPWVTIRDLNGTEVIKTNERISKKGVEKSNVKQIPKGTTLVSFKLSLGKVGIAGTELFTNEAVAALIPKNGLALDEYLFFLFQFIDLHEFARDAVKGKVVNKAILGDIPIPLPPLAVQERIVEVLQQADAIRRKWAEARRLADQILPSLFLDMFGDPATNPKGWPVEPIGNLLAPEIERVNPAKAFPDEEFTYIEIAHIDNVQFRIVTPKRLLGRNAPSRARQVVKTDDVLYSMTRPNLRNIAVVPEKLDGAIATTGFAILRSKKPRDTAFIFEMAKNPAFTTAMARFAEAKSLYPAVDEPEIRRYKIMTPPHGLRTQFAENYEFLADLDTNTRQGNEASDSLFGNLLSRAFTGELTAEWEATNADWIAERQTFYERLPCLTLLSLLLEQRRRAGRKAVTLLITALMKYAFLAQMEGELHRRLYRFVPYHYGPCAMELYNDLKSLQADGLIAVDNDAEENKTCITLTDPYRAAALLEEEAMKDDTRIAALEKAEEDTETAADPAMSRLLKRRAETLEILRADAATILDSYGNFDHSSLLKTVYERYPAYAKNSRIRKDRKYTSGK